MHITHFDFLLKVIDYHGSRIYYSICTPKNYNNICLDQLTSEEYDRLFVKKKYETRRERRTFNIKYSGQYVDLSA